MHLGRFLSRRTWDDSSLASNPGRSRAAEPARGWLTGKPEVGFPEAIANSVDRTIGLTNAVMFTDLDDLSVGP